MSVKGDALCEAQLDFTFGLNSLTPPYASVFIALNNSLWEEDGSGGNEIAGSNYARLEVDCDELEFERTGKIVTNLNDWDFVTPSGDWAPALTPATGFSVWSALSGGVVLYRKNFLAPRIILTGVPVKLLAGSVQFTEM